MKNEQQKQNRIIDEKNKPENPYVTCASAGGFIGGIAGYISTRTVITDLGFWHNPLFVGGAAVAGSIIATGFYYISKHFLYPPLNYIWERFLKRFYE